MNLVLFLTEKGHEVLSLDRNAPSVPMKWKMVDITDADSLSGTVKTFDPEYIVHLAARTDLDGKSLEDYSANTSGVLNLLKVLPELPSLKKVLITSSMLVCHIGYQPKDPFDYAPTTMYGKSKVETERLVWANRPPCDWAILRPTSIWGPYFNVPYRNFFTVIRKRRYFHIGNRSSTATYGFIGNAVYQIEQILFMPTPEENRKIFYLGDYEPTNLEIWANEIASERHDKIRKIPYWLLRCGGWAGDFLKLFGIAFPLTTFRLKNMTTDNIIDMENTRRMVPELPYTRREGIRLTLEWMDRSNL